MSGNSTVSMSFVMKDEGGGVMKMTASVADLRKVIKATVQEARPAISFLVRAPGSHCPSIGRESPVQAQVGPPPKNQVVTNQIVAAL